MHIFDVDASYATWLFRDKNTLTNLVVAYNYWDWKNIWLMNCSPGHFQHKTISAELSLICFLRAYDGIRETIIKYLPIWCTLCQFFKKFAEKWQNICGSITSFIQSIFWNYILLKIWIPDEFLILPLCAFILYCLMQGFLWVWFAMRVVLLYCF